MKLGSSNLLGMALGEAEVACVQLSGAAGRGRLQKWARWEAPASNWLVNSKLAGQQLGAFLAEKGFSARRAVLGVPARWLIAELREVPPVDRAQALASLRLQAERMSLGDDSGLVFDATGSYGQSKAGQAMLVGFPQQKLEALKQFCEAAGVEPVAVTATGLVVAELLKECEGCPVVIVSGQGSELVWRTSSGPRAFRHISSTRTSDPASPLLAAELRRALTLAQPGGGNQRLMVVGDETLWSGGAQQLSERLDRPVEATDPLKALEHLPAVASLNGQAGHVTAERLWPAVALAGSRPEDLPVNFLRSRLAPPKQRRWNRNLVAGIAAAVLVLVGIGVLWEQTRRAEARMLELEQQLAEQAADIRTAQQRIERISFGRGFFETRPPVLDCLHEITSAFGREDRIWITSFNMRDTSRGQIQGRAADQQTVLALRDRLMASPRLEEIQLVETREATGGRGETGFTLNFMYVGGAAQ